MKIAHGGYARLIQGVAFITLLLIAVACAPAPAGTNRPAGTTGPTATSASSAPPIVLGVPTDLGTIEGADSLRSVQMAVDEINAAGGVNVGGTKRPFKVVSVDTRDAGASIPVNDALQADQKLIEENKPVALLVHNFRSEVFDASMDLIPKYKIPVIATIATSANLQKNVTQNYDKYKYFFRLGLDGGGVVKYSTLVFDFMHQNLGLKSAYIVHQDVAWATGVGGALQKFLSGNGWTVGGNDTYPTGSTDFSTSLNKAIDAKVDVIVPFFDMPQSGILLKQAHTMSAPLLGGFISPVAAASAAQTFGTDVNGEVNLVFEIGQLPVKAVPLSVQYNDNYAKKYGEDARAKLAGHGPGPSYDSVYVLKAAIERAGTTDGDALVTALEATDMDGVIGHIKFGKDHQVIFGTDPKTTALGAAFQWVDGQRVPVFPASIAEAKIQLPK